MILNIVFALAIILLILIFSQSPKGESLGNAFNGEEIFISRAERTLKRATFITASLIAALLLYNMYVNF